MVCLVSWAAVIQLNSPLAYLHMVVKSIRHRLIINQLQTSSSIDFGIKPMLLSKSDTQGVELLIAQNVICKVDAHQRPST